MGGALGKGRPTHCCGWLTLAQLPAGFDCLHGESQGPCKTDQIVESFGPSYRRFDVQLQNLIDHGHCEAVRREAHSIQGGIGDIGAMDLFASAKVLKTISKNAKSAGQIDQSAVQSALREYASNLEVVRASIDNRLAVPDPPEDTEETELTDEQQSQLSAVIRESCKSGDPFELKSKLKSYPQLNSHISQSSDSEI